MQNKKTVLVTGHEGYIGGHLAKALTSQAGGLHKVVTLGSPSSVLGYEYVLKSIFRRESVDYVVHAGAKVVQGNDQSVFGSNYETTKLLVDQSVEWGAKFIFLSSCLAAKPFDSYSWSKACSEDYLRVLCPDACILRLFSVYGHEEEREIRHSIPELIARKELKYYCRPWICDFIDINYVMKAVYTAIEYDMAGTFDIGSGKGVELKELVESVSYEGAEEVGPEDQRYNRDRGMQILVADPNKWLPGWKPNGGPEEHLRNVWLWLRHNAKLRSVSALANLTPLSEDRKCG